MADCALRAVVQSWNGEVHLTVTRVWFWDGKPERVWGVDRAGVGKKFKQDEEPFVLYGPCDWRRQ